MSGRDIARLLTDEDPEIREMARRAMGNKDEEMRNRALRILKMASLTWDDLGDNADTPALQ